MNGQERAAMPFLFGGRALEDPTFALRSADDAELAPVWADLGGEKEDVQRILPIRRRHGRALLPGGLAVEEGDPVDGITLRDSAGWAARFITPAHTEAVERVLDVLGKLHAS